MPNNSGAKKKKTPPSTSCSDPLTCRFKPGSRRCCPCIFLPGLRLRSKVRRAPHSTAASCIVDPAFFSLLWASLPLLPSSSSSSSSPLLLLLCTIKYQQASFTRRRSGFHPNLIAWLAFYPPFSRRPPPPPPLVCDNATKPGLKKLTLSWTARLRSPTCCAVVPDSVDTKRSCGLYHEKV